MYEKMTPGELILRDVLAADRTLLAVERTLLAYYRTGLMLLLTAATVYKFFEATPLAAAVMVVCGVAGAACLIFGSWRCASLRRKLGKIPREACPAEP
jgi:putative membrane protein